MQRSFASPTTRLVASWLGWLFGTRPDELARPELSYAGIALTLAALGLIACVRPHLHADGDAEKDRARLVGAEGGAPRGERSAGVLLAMGAGLLYGNNFTPPTYLMHSGLGPAGALNYVFSHFCGVFAASLCWFALYCAAAPAPKLYPLATLPALLSGLMWAVAQTCWFIANESLSLSVAFPLVTSGPGVVSAMWGVLVFGEIRGARNHATLAAAVAMVVAGCTLIGASHAP